MKVWMGLVPILVHPQAVSERADKVLKIIRKTLVLTFTTFDV